MSRRRAGRRPWHRPGVAGAAAAWVVFRTAACLAAETPPGANPAEALERPVVEVIGTSPLPGLGTDKKDVPGNVQVYSSSDLSGQRQSNTTDFLEQNATSITANAAQGNPFQPDVSFRGFTASPLLGTPQGVSVFQDGVRINEPFGDIVNWDLIPQAAIAGIQVIPGSNPMFGLNTLGGAIAVYTKSGADYPGASAEVSGGSFGRRTLEAEWGASRGPLDLFITGDLFDDQGWADHNPSRVHQLFAKAGWQNDKTDLDVSLTLADNKLQGTQTLPLSLLYDIRQAYTYPDININKLTFLTVKGSRFLSDAALFGGNLYYRHYRNSSVSSNVNDDFGSVDPDSGAVDEIAATNDQSTITQDGYGGGLQVVLTGTPAGMKNQLTFGASVDEAQARFTQYSQDADLTALRGTVPAGEFELQTDADTDSRGYGVFAQNILNLTKQWTLTLSGRYNHVDIRVGDRTGTAPLLNGDTSFSRLNPSAGINFNPTDHLTAYAAYDEGARAPTAIELTCADPNAPCKLPNDFLADPPLKQVVSHTVEVGARGTVSKLWHWSAAVYQTRLSDDIEFISTSAGAGNAGYFANVGATRRRGFELSGDGRLRSLTISARYSFTDATFQSAFLQRSPDNSSADANGAIQVEPGDRIPSLPRQVLKVRLGYELTRQLNIGVNVLVSDGVYARGDENNQDVNGKLPSYTLVNLDAHYRPRPNLEIFARVNNLFDRRYYDFGILGQNFFTGPNRTFGPAAGVGPVSEQFRGPGAPLGAWIGVRYSLGAAAGSADTGSGDDAR
ncbi:MAG TPA: TonB-dependent receptor [Steroidobacteraceae bacterium]|nr:TonB-dependent receptor [Steroidobacteraceae bacterium]